MKIMIHRVDLLDMLQGEENIGMGYLLPGIFELEKTLQELKEDRNIKICMPLVHCIENSVAKRYQKCYLPSC